MRQTRSPVEQALRRLRLPLALTWAGLALERGLRAFWPLLSLLALVYAALAFGAATALSEPVLQGAAALVLLLGLAATGLGFWRFRSPRRAEALARLDATLPGRPIAALGDRMALGGAEAEALWAAHLERMAAQTARARPVPPTPDLTRRDPLGLRLAALVALAMAVVFGGSVRLSELGGALPGGGAAGPALAAAGPSWEGWATPPRYTGRPALYLNALQESALVLPEGTQLSLRLYGNPGDLTLDQDVGVLPAPAAAAPGAAQAIEWEATQSGTLEIAGPGGRAFALTVLSDEAPFVEAIGVAERRADGKLAQPFTARDDFAVLRGEATITLDLAAVDRRFGLAAEPEPREPLVFDLPLPITGSRADFAEILVEDAARHPFANLPVRLELSVEDGRGQQGVAVPLAMELPGRRFFDPLAAALIEMRRDLLWSRENAPRISEVLKAISYLPDDAELNARTYLPLRALIGQLDGALAAGPLSSELRDELAEALWLIAENVEDGGLADALAELRRAEERLSEAIRNGASADEIARLMQELKEASDNYIRMLAERGGEASDEFAQQGEGQSITGDQIQQLMDEIQRLMEDGRMAEAQELLDQLSQLLENLQVTQGGAGEGQSPGQQSMQELGETLREQQELSDDLFGQMQQPGEGEGEGGAEQQDSQSGQSGEGAGTGTGAGGDGLPDRQRALRQQLDLQQQMLPGQGTDGGESTQRLLDQAGRAMDEAERALRDGDLGQALDSQAEAIEALREGMRTLGEMLAEDGRIDGAEPGAAPRDLGQMQQRDPLGRQAGDGGQVGTDETLLRGEDVYRRARDLLEELRRRSGERLRPEAELDYLRRLLDLF